MTNNKTRLPAEKNHCLAKLLLPLFMSVAITACAMVEWPHSIEERARTVHQNSLFLQAGFLIAQWVYLLQLSSPLRGSLLYPLWQVVPVLDVHKL